MPLLSILRRSPYARLLFFFAAGIILADFVFLDQPPHLPFFLLLLLILLMTILSLVRCSFRNIWATGILTSSIIFVCGFYIAQNDRIREINARKTGVQKNIYQVTIIDFPEKISRGIKATASISDLREKGWNRKHSTIIIYFINDTLSRYIHTGSNIQATLRLEDIPGAFNPGDFDYRKYMATRHIYKQAFTRRGEWTFVRERPAFSLRIYACRMRTRLMMAFARMHLEPRLQALVSALTLGYRSDVDAQTKQAFMRAGVMHIMALSGFNVGIIAVILDFILLGRITTKVRKHWQIIKFLLIVICLWAFALVTGLSPSVTRATAMITVVLSGRILHRKLNTSNVLFLAGFFILAINPRMHADVSFQLSFAAVGGILAWQPVIEKLVVFRYRFATRLWQLFSLSCAAQLATFPLTLYYFHQFPVYFWLANLYVVPLVSVIICMAGAYLALSWLKPAIFLFSKLLALLLKGLLVSIGFIEKLPFSLISDIQITGIQAIILMVAVFLTALMIWHRLRKLIFVLLLLIIACLLISTRNLMAFRYISILPIPCLTTTGNSPVQSITVDGILLP